METSAAGSDVDMRCSSLAGYRTRKRIIGNLPRLEIAAQPDSFGIARVDGYIHASGMIEAQSAVQVGLTFRTDRQRLLELLLEGHRQRLQIPRLLKGPAA